MPFELPTRWTVCAVSLVLISLSGCAISVSPITASSHEDSPDAGCGGEPIACAQSSSSGLCSDVVQSGICFGGAWACPAGTVPFAECRCVGPALPDCTCGPDGWACPDHDAGTDAGCPGYSETCISGSNHVCSDTGVSASCVAGAWVCPADTVPSTECWCSDFDGPHAGCTCLPGGWDCAGTGDGGPIDPSHRFACGATATCDAATEYCGEFGPADGGPALTQCVPAPEGCAPARCDCLPSYLQSGCSTDATGAVTVFIAEI